MHMRCAFLLAIAACSTQDSTATNTSALTGEQCNYFAVDGRVEICHYTGAAKKPYTILRVADDSCVDGHADHAGDYVAIGDPTCGGLGCLPQHAPCDATIGCCEGTVCSAGYCVPSTIGTQTAFWLFPEVGYSDGSSTTLHAVVVADDGTAPTGTVVIASGTDLKAMCVDDLLDKGLAKCSFNFSTAGVHEITATYLGNDSYAPSSATASLFVK